MPGDSTNLDSEINVGCREGCVFCHSLLRGRAVIGFEHGPLKADGVRIGINVRLSIVVIERDITFYSDVAFYRIQPLVRSVSTE
jgi:hypothetical protein